MVKNTLSSSSLQPKLKILLLCKSFPGLTDKGFRLENIFSMEINCMPLAMWLREERKCSAVVVGLDLVLGLSIVCSLN